MKAEDTLLLAIPLFLVLAATLGAILAARIVGPEESGEQNFQESRDVR